MSNTNSDVCHSSSSIKMSERTRQQIRLGISLDVAADLAATSERLCDMSSVEEVDLYVENGFLGGYSAEFMDLMETIVLLPSLRSLHLRCSALLRGGARLPFAALQVLLRPSSGLRYLHLSNINWTIPSGTGTTCLLYTSPSPRDQRGSRMPSSA